MVSPNDLRGHLRDRLTTTGRTRASTSTKTPVDLTLYSVSVVAGSTEPPRTLRVVAPLAVDPFLCKGSDRLTTGPTATAASQQTLVHHALNSVVVVTGSLKTRSEERRVGKECR